MALLGNLDWTQPQHTLYVNVKEGWMVVAIFRPYPASIIAPKRVLGNIITVVRKVENLSVYIKGKKNSNEIVFGHN